jgi:hypothetical protein
MKNGVQRVTKRGPQFMAVTVRDLDHPLPNRKCGKCGLEIKPGMPYKWIKPKSGPYGGSMMVRCEACPTWNVWDYSSSLSARLAQISHDAWNDFPEDATTEDEISEWASGVAEQVRDLAQEKRDSADNIRDGFGHDTYQSEELDQVADDLEGWADEIEGLDVPALPEPEDEDCDACGGSGTVDNPDYDESDEDSDEDEEIDCNDCGGTGTLQMEEPSDDQISDWLEECREAASIVDESPV